MVEGVYIDNADRRKLLARWLPISLRFLHLWASLFALALVTPARFTGYSDKQLSVLELAFSTCGWSIFGLVLILMSDKALDFVLSRFGAAPIGQVVERTTTEKTVTTPANPVATSQTDAQNVDIKAENVNVGMAP